jgi:hypothetical protein
MLELSPRALRKQRRRQEAEAYAATARFWRNIRSADRMLYNQPVDRQAAQELSHKPAKRGRPCLYGTPMSNARRQKRYRQGKTGR